ncbi:9169_t:CDS:1 [Rhizophagus irregularis]|nr:9169_t:CDS:1 [Rhizophagus irregularis]
MEAFYKKVTENERQHFDHELQQLYSQGNALQHELHITKDKLRKQDKEMEEYFKAMPINQHMANIEVGTNDRPEYNTTTKVPTGQLITIEDDNDNTSKGEGSKSEGKKRCHVNEKQIDKNDMEGVTLTANGNNISMHEKNFTNVRTRYYAKININTQKLSKEEIENELEKIFNKERFRTDISNKNGNTYIYVMFATKEERTRLTNSETISNNVGRFYPDQEKEVTINDPLKCDIQNIPIKISNSDISAALDNYGLGSTNRVFNNTKTSKDRSKRHKSVLIDLKCNDAQLRDTWSIPIDKNGNRITIIPQNLMAEQKQERKKYMAKLIDVDMGIDYKDIHENLNNVKAKEWYINEDKQKGRKTITVYFKNGQERDNAMKIHFLVNNKCFTWNKGYIGQPFWTSQQNFNRRYNGRKSNYQHGRNNGRQDASDYRFEGEQRGRRQYNNVYNPQYRQQTGRPNEHRHNRNNNFYEQDYDPRFISYPRHNRHNDKRQEFRVSGRNYDRRPNGRGFGNYRNYNTQQGYNRYTQQQESNKRREEHQNRSEGKYGGEKDSGQYIGRYKHRQTNYDNDRRGGNGVHYGHRY